MTAVRVASGGCRRRRRRDGRLFFQKDVNVNTLNSASVCVCAFWVPSSKHMWIPLVCLWDGESEEENRRREGGRDGASEGFMDVIMGSQWLGHWHWDISSHPPPIIRWMDQEGVSTATYGWERMACCRVRVQIQCCFFSSRLFISSRQSYTSGYISHNEFWDLFSRSLMTSEVWSLNFVACVNDIYYLVFYSL